MKERNKVGNLVKKLGHGKTKTVVLLILYSLPILTLGLHLIAVNRLEKELVYDTVTVQYRENPLKENLTFSVTQKQIAFESKTAKYRRRYSGVILKQREIKKAKQLRAAKTDKVSFYRFKEKKYNNFPYNRSADTPFFALGEEQEPPPAYYLDIYNYVKYNLVFVSVALYLLGFMAAGILFSRLQNGFRSIAAAMAFSAIFFVAHLVI